MSTEIDKIRGLMVDALIAATCGGLAGALVGSGLLLWYAAWRVCVQLDLQRAGPAPWAALLRWLGTPAQENILLLFPCAAIGLVTGILVLVGRRVKARFRTNPPGAVDAQTPFGPEPARTSRTAASRRSH